MQVALLRKIEDGMVRKTCFESAIKFALKFQTTLTNAMISSESNTIEQNILDTAIMLGDEFCSARRKFAANDRILRRPGDAIVDLWLREVFALEIALNELNGRDALHTRDD